MTRRVLSIDGGGIRGIVPAVVVAELEARIGKPAHQMFDLIAGTSTGGILACALGIGMSAKESLRIYTERGREIFHRSLWRSCLDPFAALLPRYSPAGLNRVLDDCLGDTRLSDTKTDILVTAYDFEANAPRTFKTSDARQWPEANLPLTYVARGTSAAPTYFASQDQYWDGGVRYNNPALCAYCEARRRWPADETLVVSIGTGHKTNHHARSVGARGGLGVLAPVLDCLLEGSFADVDYMMSVLAGDRYTRINARLPDYVSPRMDNASHENIDALCRFAREIVLKSEDKLTAVESAIRRPVL